MLVFDRRVSEAIVVPQFGVLDDVKRIKSDRECLAVSAPPNVSTHREDGWSRTNPHPQPSLQQLPSEGLRILIADADTSHVRRNETYLRRLGYEVIIASDAISCVARLRRWTPHLLVLDAGLLWGRAEGVLALMDEQTEVPAIPVVVSYCEAQRSALSVMRPFRASEYVAKPIAPELMADHIRGLLLF